jgi:two-component system clock-associated histidine kinase SasA
MTLSPVLNNTRLQLLLFVSSRAQAGDLADQIHEKLHRLEGTYLADLQVVELKERPYLVEHYKLVATPALVKAYPLPAQILAGEDLTTQLEVWWPRWQGQVALVSQKPTEDPGVPSTLAFLQMSEELFQIRQMCSHLEDQLLFKDRILAMLVHDLRGPLTAATLAIDTIQNQEETLGKNLTQHLLEQTRLQLRKMDTMITDILEATRGSIAELEIQAREMQLLTLCSSVLDDLTYRFDKKQLTVTSDIPSDLPTVHGDPEKIRQVLVNLLDNAIKYTPAGGRIWLTVLHRTTQKVQVTVSDTGPGIPAEAQEKIFSDSVRLVRDEQEEGYGIGLSVCRQIVRAHYGQIWVDSTPGQGSSFHFTLPVHRT